MTQMSRRQVLAAVVLTGDPAGVRARSDGRSLSVDFDSIAALRAWLTAAGLDLEDEPREYTDAEGHRWRYVSVFPTWHGWEIYAHAREAASPAGLDPDTRARLDAVVVGA